MKKLMFVLAFATGSTFAMAQTAPATADTKKTTEKHACCSDAAKAAGACKEGSKSACCKDMGKANGTAQASKKSKKAVATTTQR